MFVFNQKTAYEMRISDWSSVVCSSDLGAAGPTMPALADSDEAVRGELETLAGKAPVESLLIPTQIIRRWVAFINSLDKDGLPVAQRPIKRVPGDRQSVV